MVRYPTALLVTGSAFTPLSVNYCRMTGTMRDGLPPRSPTPSKRGHCHPHQKFRDGEHCKPVASRRLGQSRNRMPVSSSATKAVRQAKTPVFSASYDPVRTCAHFACAGASCGQARKTRLRELPSHDAHDAQVQMTPLTWQLPE